MIYILMGVSGAGKTLIGHKLSKRLGIPFYDGDDFHPPANVQKMKSGQPLNDEDRRPWLESLANNMIKWEKKGGAILACSALKKSYRKILGSKTDTQFIYLKGTPSLIADRLAERSGHYMPPELLKSQFDALEEPDDALSVSVEPSPEEIVTSIMDRLAEKND